MAKQANRSTGESFTFWGGSTIVNVWMVDAVLTNRISGLETAYFVFFVAGRLALSPGYWAAEGGA
jgi:hypothetical protein